jgi:hypothetical protein
MKRILLGVAAALVLALFTVPLASPAQAVQICWDPTPGSVQCFEAADTPASLTSVNALEHPGFTGVPRVGGLLTADRGVWSPDAQSVRYQWLRNGAAVPGATAGTYRLTSADNGAGISLRTRAKVSGYTDAVLTTLPSPAVNSTNVQSVTRTPPITGTVPVLTGVVRVGSIISAENFAWSPTWLALHFQWQRNGANIAGANDLEYNVQAADLGKQLTLRVTGSKTGYASVSTTSAPTAAVTQGRLQAGEVVLFGQDTVGSILTYQTSGWGPGDMDWAPGRVSFRYQWLRNGTAIQGATAASYRVTAADRGSGIALRLTGYLMGFASRTEVSYPLPIP